MDEDTSNYKALREYLNLELHCKFTTAKHAITLMLLEQLLVAEPLRAMVMGAPLEDARRLAKRYYMMGHEAEVQMNKPDSMDAAEVEESLFAASDAKIFLAKIVVLRKSTVEKVALASYIKHVVRPSSAEGADIDLSRFDDISAQEFCGVGNDSCLILWDARVGTDPSIKARLYHHTSSH